MGNEKFNYLTKSCTAKLLNFHTAAPKPKVRVRRDLSNFSGPNNPPLN
jgi:hypothetical protein